jgi:hypothetical protein
MAAAEPQALDAAFQRRVTRMLEKGKEPDEIAAMLVGKGWPPEVATATAEREDRHYQALLREGNMAKTHGPRDPVRTGVTIAGTLVSIFVIYRGVIALLRLLAD